MLSLSPVLTEGGRNCDIRVSTDFTKSPQANGKNSLEEGRRGGTLLSLVHHPCPPPSPLMPSARDRNFPPHFGHIHLLQVSSCQPSVGTQRALWAQGAQILRVLAGDFSQLHHSLATGALCPSLLLLLLHTPSIPKLEKVLQAVPKANFLGLCGGDRSHADTWLRESSPGTAAWV